MNLIDYIPNNSENWSIKNNTLYFRKGGYIPILKEIDGLLFISLDQRITRQVIRITNKLLESGDEFYFCDRLTISEKHIYREHLYRIIDNYLYAISNETFYKFFSASESLDYVQNLTLFLDKFRCYELFKKRYDYLKDSYFQKKWTDWFNRKDYWEVKNEDIRDYYGILERQIKLNIFFSDN